LERLELRDRPNKGARLKILNGKKTRGTLGPLDEHTTRSVLNWKAEKGGKSFVKDHVLKGLVGRLLAREIVRFLGTCDKGGVTEARGNLDVNSPRRRRRTWKGYCSEICLCPSGPLHIEGGGKGSRRLIYNVPKHHCSDWGGGQRSFLSIRSARTKKRLTSWRSPKLILGYSDRGK